MKVTSQAENLQLELWLELARLGRWSKTIVHVVTEDPQRVFFLADLATVVGVRESSVASQTHNGKVGHPCGMCRPSVAQ